MKNNLEKQKNFSNLPQKHEILWNDGQVQKLDQQLAEQACTSRNG